ncbi:hypothetical protein C8R45DRAFT_269720 [Mycena sanguinolenta]|nr:hypothetical protein C8R45DRAFT_269720 [Mycena sanguinolenta]
MHSVLRRGRSFAPFFRSLHTESGFSNLLATHHIVVKSHHATLDQLKDQNTELIRLTRLAGIQNTRLALLELLTFDTIMQLQLKIKFMEDDFCLRSAIGVSAQLVTCCIYSPFSSEIIAELFQIRNKTLAKPIPLVYGVQAVVNAITSGAFNITASPSVTTPVLFADARSQLMAKVGATGGVSLTSVARASQQLYSQLSKHHHLGVGSQIILQEGHQTMPEAVAAMEIILFARQSINSPIDVAYQDAKGNDLVVLSRL